MRDLGDRRVDVGQRERGEQPEAAGVVDDRLTAGLVHLAGQVARSPRRRRGGRRAYETDSSDVAMPSRSISATCSSADHAGICGKPSGCAWPASLERLPVAARGGSGRGRRACRARSPAPRHVCGPRFRPCEHPYRARRFARSSLTVSGGSWPRRRGCRRRARVASPCIECGDVGEAHVLERLTGVGHELAHPSDLQVGDGAHQRAGRLVDHAEVVGEQHRDLDRRGASARGRTSRRPRRSRTRGPTRGRTP